MRPERRAVPGLAQALPALEASVEKDASPRNRMKLAEGLWLVGRTERAIRVLDGLLADDASLIAPRVLLAWCYEDAGRAEEATGCRRRILELDPANPYADRADPEAAEPGDTPPEPELEPAVEAEPEPQPSPQPEPAAVKAEPEAEAEPERALTEEELREVPPGHLYSATLAEIFARQGFQEKAIEIYRELQRVQPGRADVRDRIRRLEQQRDGTLQ